MELDYNEVLEWCERTGYVLVPQAKMEALFKLAWELEKALFLLRPRIPDSVLSTAKALVTAIWDLIQ